MWFFLSSMFWWFLIATPALTYPSTQWVEILLWSLTFFGLIELLAAMGEVQTTTVRHPTPPKRSATTVIKGNRIYVNGVDYTDSIPSEGLRSLSVTKDGVFVNGERIDE